jgi:hypothetical protein
MIFLLQAWRAHSMYSDLLLRIAMMHYRIPVMITFDDFLVALALSSLYLLF